jgi:O-antigen/teichoic acid export membrane protein
MLISNIISINFAKQFFSSGNERTLRAKKNIVVSFVCKGASILISFVIVPLTLGYVGKVEYGIWMTISSIITWFSFFDIGLGNGLRNKLAEALALNDTRTAKIYISSAFTIILGITILMFIAFYIAARFILWNKVLNTNIVSNQELYSVVLMVFFFFCIGFVLKLLSSILQAMQRYALNDILALIAQLFGLGAMYILVKTTKGSLFSLCLVYSSQTTIVMLFAAIVMFLSSLKEYRPSIRFIQLKKALPLLNLGIKFFIGQILYLIVNQTSVILVVQFFGPADVTVFNLAVRYMSVTSMLYMMVLTPFLSAFTEAYTKMEYTWIRVTIQRINMIWMFTSLVTLALVFCYRIFFKLWVGNAVIIPVALIISLAFLNILTMLNGTYSLFLNGIGKITLQLYLVGIQAFLFFPLSYLFYKLGFGLVSIVSVQIIFSSALLYFMIKQYNKIINQTAEGIWIK